MKNLKRVLRGAKDNLFKNENEPLAIFNGHLEGNSLRFLLKKDSKLKKDFNADVLFRMQTWEYRKGTGLSLLLKDCHFGINGAWIKLKDINKNFIIYRTT